MRATFDDSIPKIIPRSAFTTTMRSGVMRTCPCTVSPVSVRTMPMRANEHALHKTSETITARRRTTECSLTRAKAPMESIRVRE